jgi:4,5:9,10-diseco-3-hydroxy-5,9,17-trioxoandrosta-1(10),2-diene-4-oate hydrolase
MMDDTTPSHHSPDPSVQTITVKGFRLAYRESGQAGKPALVLLHGLAETSAFFWRPLIAHFGKDHHIIAFDLLGHGDSDKPGMGYEIYQQAQLIAEAIVRMGLAPATFIGHSLGGIISTYIALNSAFLVDKLVLYDTPLPDSGRKNVQRFIRYSPLRTSFLWPFVLPVMIRAVVTSMPIRLIMRFFLITWRVHYHVDRLNEEYLGQASRHSSYAVLEMTRDSFLKVNLIRQLQNLHVPTCIIVGDNDLMVPVEEARQWAKLIPDARFHVIENAGHVSLLDNPTDFNHAVADFLSQNESSL